MTDLSWLINRLGAAVFSTLVAVGQIVFAIGVWKKVYWLALVGRFIFGFALCVLSVTELDLVVNPLLCHRVHTPPNGSLAKS